MAQGTTGRRNGQEAAMNNLTAFQKYTALSHPQVFLTQPPHLMKSSVCHV